LQNPIGEQLEQTDGLGLVGMGCWDRTRFGRFGKQIARERYGQNPHRTAW
jgi:hypothetical protein